MSLLEKANKLLSENRLREAEFHFKTLLEAKPDNGQALFGLGRIALRLERFDAAVYLLSNASKLLPLDLDPLFALADALNAVNNEKDARNTLEHAVYLAPDNAEARYYLAQHLLAWGETDKAREQLKKGLACHHSAVTLYILLELVQLETDTSPYINQLSALLPLCHHKRLEAVCHYAIATCYGKTGEHKKAFNHLEKANALDAASADTNCEQILPLLRRIRAVFNKSYFNDLPARWTAPVTPVFIVGLPRCGATLLHQMLASHSQCAGLEENEALEKKAFPFLAKQTHTAYPECFAQGVGNKPLWQQAAQLYLDETRIHHQGGRLLINRFGDNFHHVGAIVRLFPDAKIIDLRRDFMANAWSVYSHCLDRNAAWYSSLSEFRQYHSHYEKMMEHWQAVLPGRIYGLQFEELLQDPRGQLNSLCDFLHIRFEEVCLRYYAHKSHVGSLSKADVRKPLNLDVNKAFKPYESLMLAALGERETS